MQLTWLIAFLGVAGFSEQRDLISCSREEKTIRHSFDVTCLRTDKKNCSENAPTISWDYVNLETGKVNFSILGQPCLPKDYTLKLYRYIDDTVDSCNDSSKEVTLRKCPGIKCGLGGTKGHSSMEVNEKIGISCEQVQNVTFDFIYTGKYIMDIKVGRTLQMFYSDPICFKTNFKKESLFSRSVGIVSQYISEFKQMQHTVVNFSRLQYGKFMTLHVIQNSTDLNACNGKEVISHSVYFMESGVECLSETKDMCKLHIDRENDQIDCIVDNVLDGNYCLQVNLHQGPCKEPRTSVWNDSHYNCHIHGFAENTTLGRDEGSPLTETTTTDNRVTIVLSFICMLFAIVIAVFIKLLYDRWRGKNPKDMELGSINTKMLVINIPLSEEKPEIYLVYARDCPAFMEMMVIFRNLLKQINYKVYDCFDPDCVEELSKMGSVWPTLYISSKNVKVLLIETRCAKLHYQAHMENSKIMYQEPQCWDDIFVYSLKLLLHNPGRYSYHKVFVASVSGFTSEEDKFDEITPYTRYDIPHAMDDLVCSLNQQHKVTFPESWKSDLLKLKEAVKNLVNYQTSNQDYLHEFLLRREINNFQSLTS